MEDLLKSVVDCRNLCAHHEGFWNSIAKHSISKNSTQFIAKGFRGNNRTAYFQLYIIDFMMHKITTQSSWWKRVTKLLETLSDKFKEEYMGFPENSLL